MNNLEAKLAYLDRLVELKRIYTDNDLNARIKKVCDMIENDIEKAYN